MTSDELTLFSRDALLGGWSARHATTVLFAIESRTAIARVSGERTVELAGTDGGVVLPLGGDACRLRIVMRAAVAN